jgi:hypothetical protein
LPIMRDLIDIHLVDNTLASTAFDKPCQSLLCCRGKPGYHVTAMF